MMNWSYKFVFLAILLLIPSSDCHSTSKMAKIKKSDSLPKVKQQEVSIDSTQQAKLKNKQRVISQEIDDQTAVKQASGFSKLFDSLRKPKRIPLPRTDLKSTADDGTSETSKKLENINGF